MFSGKHGFTEIRLNDRYIILKAVNRILPHSIRFRQMWIILDPDVHKTVLTNSAFTKIAAVRAHFTYGHK